MELEQIAEGLQVTSGREDGLAALRQLPAPIYALDTLHAVFSMLARSVISVDPDDKLEIEDLVRSC